MLFPNKFFSPRAVIPVYPVVAHRWILELTSYIPGIDANVADVLHSRISRWINDPKNEPKSALVSGIAVATIVGLGPQLCGTSRKAPSTPTIVEPTPSTTASSSISLVFPEVDDIDYDDYFMPASLSTGSSLSSCPADVEAVNESDSDNSSDSLSDLSVSPQTTSGVQEHKTADDTSPSTPPFAYAGFGPSAIDGIDYDWLQTTIRAVNANQVSISSTQSVTSIHPSPQPELSDSYEFVLQDEDTPSEEEDQYDSTPDAAASASCSSYDSAIDGSTPMECDFPREQPVENVPVVISDGVDTYLIHGTLGNGGFGRVMLATDQYNQRVAIKIIHKDKQYQFNGGRDSILLERRILERIALSGKRFLTPLLASWQDLQNVYFVMVRACVWSTAPSVGADSRVVATLRRDT